MPTLSTSCVARFNLIGDASSHFVLIPAVKIARPSLMHVFAKHHVMSSACQRDYHDSMKFRILYIDAKNSNLASS